MAMTDIAPALLEKIQRDFEREASADETIRRVQNCIRDGTAAMLDGHTYAQRLGEILSESLTRHLTAETLPQGKLWWNIADRTIRPMLMQNYHLTNETAARILSAIDRTQQIGLAPVSGADPAARIKGLVDKAVEEESYEGARKWMGEPVVNCSEAFFDDFVVANAGARYATGMEPQIIRTASPECCAWCAGLVGVYDYRDLEPGDDVYRRHEFCRCVVTFESGRDRQDIWTKVRWKEDASTLESRKTYNIDIDRR